MLENTRYKMQFVKIEWTLAFPATRKAANISLRGTSCKEVVGTLSTENGNGNDDAETEKRLGRDRRFGLNIIKALAGTTARPTALHLKRVFKKFSMASLKQVGDLLLISHYTYEEHILTLSFVDIFVLKSKL